MIPKNQIKTQNTILQCEHEDLADAKRVVLTDRTGEFIGPDNGLPVYIVEASSSGNVVKSIFNEISSVAIGATEIILTHTVLAGTEAYLLKVEISGTNIATYDLLVNGTVKARRRTYFSGDFEAVFDLGTTLSNSLKLAENDVVEVQVTNFRPYLGNFEARLHYIESPT